MAQDLGERMREARGALTSWHDRLNAQWTDAEGVIKNFNLSRPVWVAFRGEACESEDGNYSRDVEHCLAYVKLRGEWRLCYSLGEVGDPDSHVPKAVLDCSLEERKLALHGLPLMLSKIVDAAEAEAAEIATALGGAAEALRPFKTHRAGHSEQIRTEDGMKVGEVLKLLNDDGWQLVVTRGSHRQFKHPTKPGRVTVAGKPGDDLAAGTLNSILKQAGLKQ